MAITRSPSQTKRFAASKLIQSTNRERRLTRCLNEANKVLARRVARGQPPGRVTKTIEQLEYALSYPRTNGKKGPAGVPTPFEPPHHGKPHSSFGANHIQVWYRTASNMGVPHGGWVPKKHFSAYANASANSANTVPESSHVPS